MPPGEFSDGEIDCGPTYTVSATIEDSSPVALGGEGTGTIGFDSATVGLGGERFLVFGDHYSCGETVAVRITDDGSGIGTSTQDEATGEIIVYPSGVALPDPDLPDPTTTDDDELPEQVTLVVVNDVESTVQVNFATGSGTLATSGGTEISSQFDVRVLPGITSTGSGPCAQEYIIAASHLEPTGTTTTESTGDGLFAGAGSATFHTVVLLGDGTGTDGFDENSIAILRGRLLQLGTHYECGDTITITVLATNNQLLLDDEGNPVVDGFGNATIQYNVGSGVLTVSGN